MAGETTDQSENRGVKRKRYEPPVEEMSVRICGKLHHEMKEVHKASKKAKVFETQKVVKRLKDIRKKDDSDKAIVNFEAELTALKEVDHDSIGNSAFRSKVLKDHTLRENDDVKAAMKKELENSLVVPATAGTTLAKIQARLLSSKILANQVTASMTSLKFLLDPALKQRDNVDKSKTDASASAQSPDRPSKIRKASTPNEAPAVRRSDAAVVPTAEGIDDEESDVLEDDDGWESGSIDGEGLNDDGWESGSIGSSSDHEESEDEGSEEESDSGDEELAVKPSKATLHKPKAAAIAKPAKQASSKMESTFLPSLAVGFVRGSDDSDFSDAEGAEADMPKKNRRGQRARQAIWEKKFGRNANHKKKEAVVLAAAPVSYRNKGHARSINTGSNAIASTQGPPVSAIGKNVPQHHRPGDAGWGSRSQGVSAPATSRVPQPPANKANKTDTQKLHPSWEAKRKLKEKDSGGIVPSTGKKIKFT